ncbi:MAG TPA: formyltransferase family protein [Ktedonobacteraceae bacterium]|nr:formyltransferase family protein [Ktedonobacteraceae bacterium]
MSNREISSTAPRALFLGMQGSFSPPALLALLHNGIDVRAVVLPARENERQQPAIRRLEPHQQARPLLPVLHSSLHSSIERSAWEREIPVWEVSRMFDPATIDLFSQYRPDIICVACFSLYIPRIILDIPRLGCLNVHPSLLPANRGPDPLFWTFHQGHRETGITIHLMDEGLDTGPIVAQERVAVPDGISYAHLEEQCAELGGSLLARSAWQLYHGSAVLTPQDEAKSSYLPMPTGEDFVVPTSAWEARRVYNFMHGLASRGEPFTLLTGGQSMRVTNAISYSHEDTSKGDLNIRDNAGVTTRVRCKDGWVYVR